jgi:hypothetical protein
MVQEESNTVNPAGSPDIKPVSGEDTYSRDDFTRDLENVTKSKTDEGDQEKA